MKLYLVLVTTPNRKTSEKISKGVLKSHLAACVNAVPGVRSRYRWKGKVRTAREELLLLKTTGSRLPKLVKWVKAHHPYEICEVLAFKAEGGSMEYLRWIKESLL